MGKSKFPGKPSKSQNKKHISVLTGEVICEGDVSITNDKLSVLHKTFSDQVKFIVFVYEVYILNGCSYTFHILIVDYSFKNSDPYVFIYVKCKY